MEIKFEYYEPPVIYNATPNSGFIAGGEIVTIHGDHFRRDQLYCIFGHLASPQVSWLSSRAITCISPPLDDVKGYRSPVTIKISNNKGNDYSIKQQAYKYTKLRVTITSTLCLPFNMGKTLMLNLVISLDPNTPK